MHKSQNFNNSDKSPLVSIITPAYNVEKYIGETIQSVINQTYTNWELLICVDKNSSDQTLNIVKKLAEQDSRIKYFDQLSEGGVAYNRNYAIERSTGDYICFLDSDDIWQTTKLYKQLQFMQKNSIELSCTGYQRINEQGLPLNQKIWPRAVIQLKDLFKYNDIGCLTVMIHSKHKRSIQFKPGFHEDFTLWLDLIRKTNQAFHGLNECLASYRVLPQSRSSDKKAAALWRLNILNEQADLNLLQKYYYFLFYIFVSFKNRI